MRVFKTKLIRLQLTAEELDALTADFISYKRDGCLLYTSPSPRDS